MAGDCGYRIFLYFWVMKLSRLLPVILLTIVVAACHDKDYYTLDVTIDGIGTRNVNLYIYSDNGLKTVSLPAVDNKFSYKSSTDAPVFIDFMTNDNRSLGFLMVENGDEIEARFAPGRASVTSIKGNEVSERLADFMSSHASLIDSLRPAELNSAIERYVSDNPDDIVSGIVVSRFYDATVDPEAARQLIERISPSARPVAIMGGYSTLANVVPDTTARLDSVSLYTIADGLKTFSPVDSLGLLVAVVGPDDVVPHDSTIVKINAARDTLKTRLKFVELALVADTAALRSLTDSIKPAYPIGWLPGGVANPEVSHLNIKQLPMIIVADSTGTIIYRGDSLEEGIEQFTTNK